MANTLKFGDGKWATGEGTALAFNDENDNFKPLPFTFTRNSSATVVNQSGLIEEVGSDVPRIDFKDNTKGALLLEPSRSNYMSESEDFSLWTLNGDSVTKTSNNAFGKPIWTLTESSTSNLGMYRFMTGIAVGSITFSVLVKAGSSDEVTLRFGSPDSKNAIFNLSTGTVAGVSTGATASIKSYGNDWYLCTNTITITTSTATGAIYTNEGSVDVIYAQVEQGSYPTSYIPTNGSSVTRAGDSCSGAGNSEVFNDSEGVLFIETAALFDDTTNRYIGLNDGTTSNRILIGYSTQTNRIRVLLSDGGVQKAIISYDVTDRTNFSKMAVKYKENDVALWVDGVERGTDTTATMPSGLDELDCNSGAGLSPFLGKIKQIKVYNTALTDAELATLTT